MSGESIVVRPKGLSAAFDYLPPALFFGIAVFFLAKADFAGTVIGIAFGAVAAAWAWALFARRAELSRNRIDYFNGYWWRSISRKAVKGMRVRASRAGDRVVLESNTPDEADCTVPGWVRDHPDARDWFAGVADLDAADARAAEAALESDAAFGPDAETRLLNARRVGMLALGLAAAAVAASFAFEIGWAGRWVMVGVMLLPFVAVALNLAFPQQLRLAYENGKRDPRPSLLGLLIVPAFAFLIIGIGDFNLEGGYRLMKLALPCALAAMIYGAVRVPEYRRSIAGVAGLVALPVAFFWGAFAFIDVKFDDGPRHIYATRIDSMRVHSGRSTTYYLTLAPWSRLNLDPEVSVRRSFYESVQIGSVVCVVEGRGVLGVGWYQLEACPQRAPGLSVGG